MMDIYYSAVPNYVSLLQLDNINDGDLFGRGSGNSLTTDFLKIYVDGTLINSVDAYDAARFDLSDPSFLVFADEDGETANGYISQFHFSDRAYSGAEIGALGGAHAAAIPEPSGLLLSAGAALGLLTRRRRA